MLIMHAHRIMIEADCNKMFPSYSLAPNQQTLSIDSICIIRLGVAWGGVNIPTPLTHTHTHGCCHPLSTVNRAPSVIVTTKIHKSQHLGI